MKRLWLVIVLGMLCCSARAADTDAPKDPLEVTTRALLDNPAPVANFQGVALPDVIDFLHDISGINFYIDWSALSKAGINKSTTASARFESEKLSGMLRKFCDGLDPKEHLVDYDVIANVVVISTSDGIATLSKQAREDLKLADKHKELDQTVTCSPVKALGDQIDSWPKDISAKIQLRHVDPTTTPNIGVKDVPLRLVLRLIQNALSTDKQRCTLQLDADEFVLEMVDRPATRPAH